MLKRVLKEYINSDRSSIAYNNMAKSLSQLFGGSVGKSKNILSGVNIMTKEDMRALLFVFDNKTLRDKDKYINEKKTKNTIKPLNERLNNIPAIIEDKEKALSEYNQIDFDGTLNEINEKKKLIEDIDAQMLGKAEALKPILAKRDAIFEIISKKRYDSYIQLLNEIRSGKRRY